MLTITDRDLLILDPSIFVGAAAAAGTVLLTAADATITGTELQSTGSDFAARGIDAGLVAVINDAIAVEIVSRTGETALEVSLPRVSADDDQIPPGDAADAQVIIVSFARLIDLLRTQVIQGLGIDESNLVDVAPLSQLIVLRTIAHILAHASAAEPADESLRQRSMSAAIHARQALHRTLMSLDADGDGSSEVTRPLDVIRLKRG